MNISYVDGVLVVEQMMTTGGGWQDQIGGLLPAFKLGTSKAELPLEVNWNQLAVKNNGNETFWNGFDERIILVYTGQTRLARNLLQSVLRNWYSGIISQLFDELEENAVRAAAAVEQGSFFNRRTFENSEHSFRRFSQIGRMYVNILATKITCCTRF